MPAPRSNCEQLDLPDIGAEVGSLDLWAASRGFKTIVGVDEVGRGPLAGPVVAAAVLLPGQHSISGLTDSKKLSARRREQLTLEIRVQALAFAIAEVDHERIDAINIRQASLEAMAIALADVCQQQVSPDLVLVDGLDACRLPEGAEQIRVMPFKRADGLSEAVAAASIIAKVHRDALMLEFHRQWPEYGFDRNKGYPTAAHKSAIRLHGPCRIHRRSFRGVVLEPE